MVTRKTGNPRGRPRKLYREDPDRYAIAFALALQQVYKQPEASAFLLAAAAFFGKETAPPAKLRRRHPPATVLVSWETLVKPGAVLFQHKATTLRLKANRVVSNMQINVQDAKHLDLLTSAFCFSLDKTDKHQASFYAAAMLNWIGEDLYGQTHLIPMIMAKAPRPI